MPFEPTHDGRDNPTCCHVCGRQAEGVGIGRVSADDPRFLCAECLTLLERIKDIRQWKPYEKVAFHGGMDAAGPLVSEFGADLSQWDEAQVLRFVETIWRGCVDKLHESIRDGEAPF